MPLYEFFCPTCDRSFDVRRTFSEGTDNVVCILCAEENVQRVFTPVAVRSNSGGKTSAVGGSSCSGCATTSCAGCASGGRK